MKYKQGFFKPLNPQKYRGNHTNIIYRSGLELKAMSWLDRHPDVLWWKSEEVIVHYRSPLDGKPHRYFPDLIACMKTKDGEKTFMIEVKPDSQCIPPKPQEKMTKGYIHEVKAWGINSSKWEAARAYCKAKGWEFQLIGEKALGVDYK